MNEGIAVQRLLVVDDDVDIRTLLAEQLSKAGYAVSTAGDGVEMRRVLEREHVDLVVLDLNLPKEDGLTLCREIVEAHGGRLRLANRSEGETRTGAVITLWLPEAGEGTRSPQSPGG